MGGRDAAGEVLPPPRTFLLMLLWPKQVKYFRLTDNFAQLDRPEINGEIERPNKKESIVTWSGERVNP